MFMRLCVLGLCLTLATVAVAAPEDLLPEAGRTAVKEIFPGLTITKVKEMKGDAKQFAVSLMNEQKKFAASATVSEDGKVLATSEIITEADLPQVVQDGLKPVAEGATVVSVTRLTRYLPVQAEGKVKKSYFYDVVLNKDDTTGTGRFLENGKLKAPIQWKQSAPKAE